MYSTDSNAIYSRKARAGMINPNPKYTPGLTKQELVDRGIKLEDGKVYQWSNKLKDYVELDIKLMTTKPKYGKERSYKVVYYYKKEKHVMFPINLHRLIYVWYKGDIPQGYVVDHIDNNQLNNDPDNLQLLTRGENVKKNNNGHNQFTVTKDNPALYEECRKRLSESMRYLKESGNKEPNSGWGNEAKIRSIDRQIAKLEKEIEFMRYTSTCNHSEEFYEKKERNLRAKIEILQKEKISLK